MDQIEVVPVDDGWEWQKRVDGGVVEGGVGYPDRSSAIAAARDARGDIIADVVHDGVKIGETAINGDLRIVLLRRDGSLHGELYPAKGNGGPAQHITLTPAGETDEAVRIDG